MGIEFSFAEVIAFLEENGLTLPSWVIGIVLLLIFAQFLGLFTLLGKVPALIRGVGRVVGRFRYDAETKRFIIVRNRFAEHLISEIKRLNREADWNDFYYTQLEATVEVDQSGDYGERNLIVTIWNFLTTPIRRAFGIGYGRIVKDSLIQAIESSSSRTFLVIGDPGSGKTVSLRHLFLRLAQKAAMSKNRQTVLPIYLNLKSLDIPAINITADDVRQWILTQIETGQDRLIYGFLDNHFEEMLDTGQFFFLFDSFDEIPAVMDAHEDAEIVRAYALALHRFLTAPHGCSGLISSRPYRAPKIFVGQRLTIRSLDDKRIRNALDKYLTGENALFRQIWDELITQKRDLLKVARNPFYLSLIARYTTENRALPTRHYDLFDHFVQSRVLADEQRLAAYELTPANAVQQASRLAYQMMQTDHVGLVATEDELRKLLQTHGWKNETVTRLLGALTYSKLGTLSTFSTTQPKIFSFVHRRFHEYFCALYLREHAEQIPIADLMLDNRWREVLVLLCEILSVEHLKPVFEIADDVLMTAHNEAVTHQQKRYAFEVLSFLKDGFRSRLSDLPQYLRETCGSFIDIELRHGTILDQKRAIENIGLAPQDENNDLIYAALESDSDWVRGAAIEACEALREMTIEVEEIIRDRLLLLYRHRTLYPLPRKFHSLENSANPLLRDLGKLQKRFRSVSILMILMSLLMTILLLAYLRVDGPQPSARLILLISLLMLYLGGRLKPIAIMVASKTSFGQMTGWLFRSMRLLVGIGAFFAAFFGATFGLIYLIARATKLTTDDLLLIVLYGFISVQALHILLVKSRREKWFKDLRTIASNIFYIFHDLRLVIGLLYRPQTCPRKSQDVPMILEKLRTNTGNVWFVRNLSRWIPFDSNSQPLIYLAQNSKGELRDALFQVVEMWEDSAEIVADEAKAQNSHGH